MFIHLCFSSRILYDMAQNLVKLKQLINVFYPYILLFWVAMTVTQNRVSIDLLRHFIRLKGLCK